MKIILLGAPGCGKGTQAKKITKDFNIPQISTGDLFRAIVKEESELANSIKDIMAGGGLVPDELTVALLRDRISKEDCKNGFILDGFPRTVAQAKALETISDVDAIILIDVAPEVIIERLSARRTCSGCGEIYNTESYSKDTCEKCGANLIQRDDDKPETIKHRLEVYDKNTSPLIDFYSDRLFKVVGQETPDQTYQPVKAYLQSLEA